MSGRTKFVQVGLGGRHEMFRDAVMGTFSEHCEMVGLCDSNQGRLDLSVKRARERFGITLPGYSAQQFKKMITDTRPDFVIVTSIDHTHDHYICKAMEMGCDVITEKPMTIDADKCQRIIDTQKKTDRQIRVTFNYRYSPARTQVKELIMSGIIGDLLSIDFHWLLDTTHGADYYRRWHRNKSNSGGLMVHKSTHHFDLVNWWIDSVPEIVSAQGQRQYYTPAMADQLGLTNRAERCHGCPESGKCQFYLDMAANLNLKELYLDCESFDHYYRDRCLFSDQIDIEDTMHVHVNYQNGVKMSYSLNSFTPYEGYVISFNGTKGRLEHTLRETVYINADGRVPGEAEKDGTWTRIFPHDKEEYDVEVSHGKGGHGGGDDLLLQDTFFPEKANDPYKRAADHRSGAWSILTGIAANLSMKENNRPVKIRDLVSGLALPD